jgi:hypothetical protein
MAVDKLRTLINRLLNRTRTAELRWSETPSQEAFQTSFPNYSVEVEQAEGGIFLRVYNSEGRVLDWTSDARIGHEDKSEREQTDDAEKLEELFSLARRQALGTDRALDELLTELS